MAILAPGQGAQKPGMLSPWLELDGVAERVAGWSELIGLDLARLGTTADAEEIQDTAITQPLIVAASLIAYAELAERVDLPATAPVAGHSIGELAAAAIAGVFSLDDAVSLAAVRGREMAAACALEPTGMVAVMGGEPDAVVSWLAEFELTPANMNGAGQIVAAGSRTALEKLSGANRPGTKIIALKVAGAFHTHYMAPAEAALRERAGSIQVADPTRPLLSNADGAVVDTGAEELNRLIAQVLKPVRWDRCMATLAELGVTGTIELPPAGALTGLVKRELKGTATLPLKSPDDLDKLASFVAEHEGNS
ncbi:MAG TPA: ACP S-malonyltransferase [Pseudonocardiaceae bacterium]|jgi:[acyl-carrier-protein] S-malonyltransferase|nr:ACP S-malonyltransferase [Pseudonocardiaceae bacterium]